MLLITLYECSSTLKFYLRNEKLCFMVIPCSYDPLKWINFEKELQHMWRYLNFSLITANVKPFTHLAMSNSFVLYCFLPHVFYITTNVLLLPVDLGWWVLNKGWTFPGCTSKNGDERFATVTDGIEQKNTNHDEALNNEPKLIQEQKLIDRFYSSCTDN